MATVNPRAKGVRAETQIRDQLRVLTGLQWERVPSSGALDPKHLLKGDLYVPGEKNLYAVEVKHYAESHIDHLLVSGKNHQLLKWVIQTIRQGKQVDKKPLLIFKHDRSPNYCAFIDIPEFSEPFIYVSKEGYEFYISLLEDFINNNKPKFIL